MMTRHLVLMAPVAALLALLPAEWGIRVAVVLLALLSSTFVVAINMSEIRRARLRQHGLSPPDDPDRHP